MTNAHFTDLLTGLLALLLIVAAVVDIRTFTISNRLVMAVVALAPLYWWSIGLPVWPDAAWRLGVATAVFVGLAITFYLGMMGGGDVKLAGALALWLSPAATLKFLVLMSLSGGALTLAIVIAHRIRSREGRPKIPYGVAIAFGGLWLVAQRFLNQFA